ncbi:hypothetical protein BV898_07950 [Hypsibius exemplaris]|uniref:Gustatory receptor n=1 Tax=Hypsibius exemplaris TaxID=2072580 RepID=A0A1W0WS30_HYPEX|nr:hypothetical protein BV898_07950 [Hypsibius exemplaris]
MTFASSLPRRYFDSLDFSCFPDNNSSNPQLTSRPTVIRQIFFGIGIGSLISTLAWGKGRYKENCLLNVLYDLPDRSLVIRSILVLATLFRKRSHWETLRVQYVLIECLFGILPFLLSQQAQLCEIILVTLLFRSLSRFLHEIRDEGLAYQNHTGDVILTFHKVHRWRKIHARMKRFVADVLDSFQFIFLVGYLSDTLNVLGSTSFIISTDLVTSYWSYLHSIGTFVTFELFASLFSLPLIQVHESSIDLASLNF